MSEEKNTWVMPEFMEKYREHFTNTGGNTVEELMNWKGSAFANLPMALLSSCASSQVGLLTRLNAAGLLK